MDPRKRAHLQAWLEQLLNEARLDAPFKLRDASFKGEPGFAEGYGPEDISRVLRELNEGRALP